jgi:biopolymer transport protein ExbD
MKINLGQKEEAKFEMAPMIDMVFLLLVFFMMASQMAQIQNIKMEIPEATKSVVPKERPNRWIVNITKDGHIFEGERPIELSELSSRVKKQIEINPETKIYLRADKATKHKDVKKVMTEMAKAGVSDFIFATFIKQTK